MGSIPFGVYGVILFKAMIVLPAFLPFKHLSMATELCRYAKAANSVASKIAGFYQAVIPKAAVDTWTALPAAAYEPGEDGYQKGSKLKNTRWGVVAGYVVAGWIFLALQFAVIFGAMLLFARICAPLMWIPFTLAIVHYAIPIYLLSHFSYMKYVN